MKRSIFAAAAGAVLILLAPAAAQDDHPADDPPARSGWHPRYGPPEIEPVRPEAEEMDPEEDPGPIRQSVQLSADLENVVVFDEEWERLGEVVDLIVNLPEKRLAYVVMRPEGEPGVVENIDLVVDADLFTVREERLVMHDTAPLVRAADSQVIRDALLGELLAVPDIARSMPAVVRVERAAEEPVAFGERGRRGEPGLGEQRPAEAELREARVPPEVRGGVPPEVRGGIPPERDTPVPASDTGLEAGGPTGSTDRRRY